MSAGTTRAAKPQRDNPAKVSIASMIGTAVEAYDFFIYGTAAAAYFGTVFFHADDPIVGVLQSFAVLAVGFFFRPLGGYLAGHYGDRIGRKTILIASLIVMGAATFLVGLLPTYDMVGVFAPILLLLLRAIQGVGFGAEWGGAVLMAVEHAPERRRGFFGSVPQIGIPAGLLLANGTFLLSTALFEGDWVWRVPFLLSIVMVAIGMYIRLGVTESPEFEKMKAAGEIHKAPALEVMKRDWRLILRVIGLRLAETGGYYVTTSFVLSYVGLAAISETQYVLWGTLIGSALGLVSHLLYGALSDRIGRKRVFLIGSIFTIAFGIPMFLLINTGAVIMVIVAVAVSLLFSHDPIFAVESSWFSELFSRDVRSSGISLGYNGASIVAGALPFLATALYAWVGWMGPALLFVALGVISTATAAITRETAPVKVGFTTDAASDAAHSTPAPERAAAR
ncbi:MFS transporter [Agromyces aerolatus]|uniref:MFS transporter n=1 Tax=Agromyces sp. LY-1074 TaxID=3074080 RepID=UPI0028584DFD|nr:MULTISPECIES: MFS transporter [unclassified Agromyces]MDR5699412.1 MFS transporter [Agromyces sp. LY-1074]MDR5705708.1 MFS transporter [Agromyces sp. LY-1358]